MSGSSSATRIVRPISIPRPSNRPQRCTRRGGSAPPGLPIGEWKPLPLEMMAALSPRLTIGAGRIRQAEFSVPAQRLTEINSEGSRRRLGWQRHFPRFPIAGAGSAIRRQRHNAPPYPTFPLRKKLSVRIRTVPLDEDYWLEREKRTGLLGAYRAPRGKPGR